MCICKRDVNRRPIVAGETRHAAIGDWPKRFSGRNVAGRGKRLMSARIFRQACRLDPELGLGNCYGNFPAALGSYYNLRFPNGDTPYIGDGERLACGTKILTTPEGTRAAYWCHSEIR